MYYDNAISVSKKDWFMTVFLVVFGGFIGLHRFYCEKFGTGVLYVLTFGLCGIGLLIDSIQIVRKRFRDKSGAIVCYSQALDC